MPSKNENRRLIEEALGSRKRVLVEAGEYQPIKRPEPTPAPTAGVRRPVPPRPAPARPAPVTNDLLKAAPRLQPQGSQPLGSQPQGGSRPDDVEYVPPTEVPSGVPQLKEVR